jgi:transcriptional regulator with XRE-family HTH domain
VAKKGKPVDVYVGARLKMRRHELGMSQGTLAGAIKLTFQQVQKYEKGTNRMGASRLMQIANVLDVPPTFFFEGGPDQKAQRNLPSPDYADEFIKLPDGPKLIRAFQKISSAKLRRSIVTMVENIAGEE